MEHVPTVADAVVQHIRQLPPCARSASVEILWAIVEAYEQYARACRWHGTCLVRSLHLQRPSCDALATCGGTVVRQQ
jgi:hypothetical protein